jgi:hypothetical protein
VITENAIAPQDIGVKKISSSYREKYVLCDRKLCYHTFLYDPFRFGAEGDPQSGIAYRCINECQTKKNIESIFSVRDTQPELTVLLNNGSFVKISTRDIPDFLKQKKLEGEIDEDLCNAIKSDYLHLFYPLLDGKATEFIYHQVKELVNKGIAQSKEKGKPILIVLAEIHNSKNSFLLQIMVLLIAKELAIQHLLVETINLYHKKYGWDAPVEATNSLIQFADTAGFHVKDLESNLHYNNIETPYPYHDIPEGIISEKTREASWIIYTTILGKNAILILGAGHLNRILNSELENNFVMLPINCTCEKQYSDNLSITSKNFIAMEYNLSALTFNEIIKKAQAAHEIF